MQLSRVSSNSDFNRFLEVPIHLYRDDENYIPILNSYLRSHLLSNKKYHVELWYLNDRDPDGNQNYGRIAAFFKDDEIKGNKKVGRIGFFECSNSDKHSKLLFDVALNYLAEKGIEKVIGPVNPGERDSFWGLLVNTTYRPTFAENYNHAYYQKLFLNYGFVPEYEQITPRVDLLENNLGHLKGLLIKIRGNNNIVCKNLKELNSIQIIKDFVFVYNEAWKGAEFFSPITIDEVEGIFKQLKPLIVEEAICFAYRNQKPIGFFVSVLDVNPIISKIGPKLNWWRKIKWMYLRKTMNLDTLKGLVFGIIEEERDKGIPLLLADYLTMKITKHPQIKYLELSWIGSFNPKMLKFVKRVGAKPYKKHVTYGIDIHNRITK